MARPNSAWRCSRGTCGVVVAPDVVIDTGRHGLSLLCVEDVWTENAKRQAGLPIPVVKVIRVCTAERLDTPQGVRGAAIHVEIFHISAELFHSHVHGSNEQHPQLLPRTLAQSNADFTHSRSYSSSSSSSVAVVSNKTDTYSKSIFRGI